MATRSQPRGRSRPPNPLVASLGRERNPLRRLARVLGPGFVTGASDDDPSGIATYANAGAAFGYGLLWTAPVTFGLMAVVQFICAKVGLVSGKGPTGVLRDRAPRWVLFPTVIALLVANTINVGVDLGAIAASVLISDDPRVMGDRTNGRLTRAVGWLTVAIMARAAIGLVVTSRAP